MANLWLRRRRGRESRHRRQHPPNLRHKHLRYHGRASPEKKENYRVLESRIPQKEIQNLHEQYYASSFVIASHHRRTTPIPNCDQGLSVPILRKLWAVNHAFPCLQSLASLPQHPSRCSARLNEQQWLL